MTLSIYMSGTEVGVLAHWVTEVPLIISYLAGPQEKLGGEQDMVLTHNRFGLSVDTNNTVQNVL